MPPVDGVTVTVASTVECALQCLPRPRRSSLMSSPALAKDAADVWLGAGAAVDFSPRRVLWLSLHPASRVQDRDAVRFLFHTRAGV